MAYVIPAITAPDNYTVASTIDGIALRAITIDVVNSSIYWQLKLAISGSVGAWEENVETPMTPGSRTIEGDKGEIVGIRVRAKIPASQIAAGGKQAIVTVRADT